MKDYAVLPGWLPAAELPDVRAAAAALDAVPGCPRENNTLMPLRWNDDLVNRLVADAARVDALRAATGATGHRRDAVLLSFAPHWSALPAWRVAA